MNVLGICQSHSSAACLMVDGAIVGMIQEERHTRRKNQVAFPKLAIADLVDRHLEGDFGRIDRVVFAEKQMDPYGVILDRYSEYEVIDHVREQYQHWYPHFYGDKKDIPGYWFGEEKSDGSYWLDQIHQGQTLNKDHNHDFSFITPQTTWEDAMRHFSEVERPAALQRHFGWKGPISYVDHHECHAYYALYGNLLPQERYEDALVLTADAWGEQCNWSAWLPDGDGRLEHIERGTNHAVARLYKFTTLILGMKPNEHEYKVMGLAPYSRSRRHIAAAEKVFFETLDFRDGAFVSERPLTDSYFDLRNRLEGHRFDNVAAALQNWSTQVTCAWARHWLDKTQRRTLCFSGGLSMNIRANGALLGEPGVDWLSVPASGGDESLCAGACFSDRAASGGKVVPIRHVYLGRAAEPAGNNWHDAVEAAGGDAKQLGVRAKVTAVDAARLLAADCILARCVGPSEFGARALGNRSILANPASPDNVRIINDAIKNRDFWMPFTPSILAEHADRYLVNSKQIRSPFMTVGFDTKPAHRHEIIAALHPADYSARPQFVDRESNPDYWRIIEEFRRLTGIAAVLNTSLNLHGEPMNYSLADAIRTLVLSELDFLLMPGGQLLFKTRAAKRLADVLDQHLCTAN